MNTFPPELLENVKTMTSEARARLDELERVLASGNDLNIRLALSRVRIPLKVAATFVAEQDAHTDLCAHVTDAWERRMEAGE